MDIEGNLRRYIEGIKPLGRYASFDYCFNYFQSIRERNELHKLTDAQHLEQSCLQLGFYLASWGMFRGSSFLPSRSVKVFAPVLSAVAASDAALWSIDAHCYTDDNIAKILDFRKAIIFALHEPTDILVTKIMLGVFGNVPAFDTNFMAGFGVGTFGKHSLEKIGQFYAANSSVVDQYRRPTLNFTTEQPTQRKYTRAKVIDMIFFIEGGSSQ